MKTVVVLVSLAVAVPALAEEPANTAAKEVGPAKTGSTGSTAVPIPSKSDATTSATDDTISKTTSTEPPAASPAAFAPPTEKSIRDAEVAALRSRVAELEGRLAQLKAAGVPREDTKTEGLIPGLLFGPKLSIISLPTPAVGIELKAWRLFGASFDYGFIPDFTVSNVTLGMKTWNAGAKLYPFRGAFFLAANLSHYKFTGKSTVTDATGQPAQARLDISTTSLTPEIGWRWVWTSGFFTGVDLGWQFPLSYNSTLIVPAGASPGTIKDIRDNADEHVKSGIPSLGLFQLGWFL
jgi:hypothetical protein